MDAPATSRSFFIFVDAYVFIFGRPATIVAEQKGCILC